ncbi:MAG: hypothetical protein CMK74_00140 [Pseudomonadales bacterium]|jgi:hypothetical protein|nr:hypothetical protein [Pseudomonadales bacterium]
MSGIGKDRVISVRLRKDKNLHRLRYVEKGRLREENFQTREEALAAKKVVQLRLDRAAGAPPIAGEPRPTSLKLGEGTMDDWAKLLWFHALRSTQAPGNVDYRQSADAVGKLAKAARPFVPEPEKTTSSDEISKMSTEDLEKEVAKWTADATAAQGDN